MYSLQRTSVLQNTQSSPRWSLAGKLKSRGLEEKDVILTILISDREPILGGYIQSLLCDCHILTYLKMLQYSESNTFPVNWLQKFSKPRGDPSHCVTGVSSLRQQEGQVEVEALLQLDVPSFAPNQVICRGVRGCHYGID